MKTQNIFLTSVIAMTLVVPALADPVTPNIAVGTNSAACNESVLETTSGTSNLEANWNANTLYLSWSVDGQPYATNDSNAASCTYDSGITIPTNPSKTGYTFAGWTVKVAVAQCDFSGLSDTTTNGRTDNNGFASNDGTFNQNVDQYGLTQGSGEWAAEFYHGIIKGVARCSLVGSGMLRGQTGNPTDDLNAEGAEYCWCQPTSYTPKPWTYDTGDASSGPIYLTGYTNKSECRTAIQAITGLNYSNANTLLNNANNENPQLITNATGANLAYLTDSGCTTTGSVTGHFGEMGSACPVAASSWVFLNKFDSSNPFYIPCATICVLNCVNNVQSDSGLRAAVFGAFGD